jgi:hypothetical protein
MKRMTMTMMMMQCSQTVEGEKEDITNKIEKGIVNKKQKNNTNNIIHPYMI